MTPIGTITAATMPSEELATGTTSLKNLRIGRWLGVVALTLTLGVLSLPTNVSAQTPPEEAHSFIQALAAQAIEALDPATGTLQEREGRVRLLLSENLDLERMGRFALASNWKKAKPDQRMEYMKLFSEFVLSTYSRQLGGYTGQTLNVVGAEKLTKRDALVSTEIHQASGPPIAAAWRVRKFKNGDFKILDVVFEKLSMVQAQQEQFMSIASRDGVDGVIQMLRLKLTKYGAQS